MARFRCNELTQLPWLAPRWDGKCPTLMHLETIMIPREVYPLFHYEINETDLRTINMHPHIERARLDWAERFGRTYPQESAGHMDQGRPWNNMNDLHWNLFLQVIFTRCVLLSTTPARAVVSLAAEWNADRFVFILHRLGLADLNLFCEALWHWVVSNREALFLVNAGHDDSTLKELCRPGAWLLDCVHTEVLVILRGRSPWPSPQLPTWSPSYIAVGNVELRQLAESIFHWDDPLFRRNRNYVGNVMEHLAWLAFEDSREDIILAMAYWLALRR